MKSSSPIPSFGSAIITTDGCCVHESIASRTRLSELRPTEAITILSWETSNLTTFDLGRGRERLRAAVCRFAFDVARSLRGERVGGFITGGSNRSTRPRALKLRTKRPRRRKAPERMRRPVPLGSRHSSERFESSIEPMRF